MDLKDYIRDIPDFPKKGIVFKDITTLLKDPAAFRAAIDEMATAFKGKGIQKVCGIESRGFIFAAPLALKLGAGFIPIRKDGKLPWTKLSQEYTLEYGTDKIEVHKDAIEAGEKVLVVDDLLATGGTARATHQLLEQMKAAVVGYVFLIELGFLNGRAAIKDQNVLTLIRYD